MIDGCMIGMWVLFIYHLLLFIYFCIFVQFALYFYLFYFFLYEVILYNSKIVFTDMFEDLFFFCLWNVELIENSLK